MPWRHPVISQLAVLGLVVPVAGFRGLNQAESGSVYCRPRWTELVTPGRIEPLRRIYPGMKAVGLGSGQQERDTDRARHGTTNCRTADYHTRSNIRRYERNCGLGTLAPCADLGTSVQLKWHTNCCVVQYTIEGRSRSRARLSE